MWKLKFAYKLSFWFKKSWVMRFSSKEFWFEISLCTGTNCTITILYIPSSYSHCYLVFQLFTSDSCIYAMQCYNFWFKLITVNRVRTNLWDVWCSVEEEKFKIHFTIRRLCSLYIIKWHGISSVLWKRTRWIDGESRPVPVWCAKIHSVPQTFKCPDIKHWVQSQNSRRRYPLDCFYWYWWTEGSVSSIRAMGAKWCPGATSMR